MASRRQSDLALPKSDSLLADLPPTDACVAVLCLALNLDLFPRSTVFQAPGLDFAVRTGYSLPKRRHQTSYV